MRVERMFMAGVLVAGLSLPAVVQAQKVDTDYDHKADFASYKTFSFIKVQTADPLNEDRVRDGITQELTKRGLEMVPSGGDLEIAAVGGLHTEQEYNTFYSGLGGGWGWGGWGYGGWGGWGGPRQTTTTVNKVHVGTLRVDLYAEGSHQLVWRGIASKEVSDKSDKNAKNLQKAIDKMFDKFPPKGNS